jgi:hypothetical protein
VIRDKKQPLVTLLRAQPKKDFRKMNSMRTEFDRWRCAGKPMLYDKPTPTVNNLLIIEDRQAAEREKSRLSANCINSRQ